MMEAFQKCPFHRWLNLIIKRTPSCSSFANWVSGEKCPFSNIAIFCLRLLGTQPSDEASSPSGGEATRPRRISRELPQTYFVCSFLILIYTHIYMEIYIWMYISTCTQICTFMNICKSSPPISAVSQNFHDLLTPIHHFLSTFLGL